MSQTCRSWNVIKGFPVFSDRTRRQLAHLLLLINEQLNSIPAIITSSVNHLLALFSHYAPSFTVYAVMLTVLVASEQSRGELRFTSYPRLSIFLFFCNTCIYFVLHLLRNDTLRKHTCHCFPCSPK